MPPTAERLTEQQLARVARIIARASGLATAGERSDYLRRRLAGHIDTHGSASLDSLLQRSERGDQAAIEELRNALAVNYTYFWREPEHFQILLEHVMTTLRTTVGVTKGNPLFGTGGMKCPEAGAALPTLRLWSAGCASGEEAWSMAIVAAEAIKLTGIDAHIEILATDIDTDALREAEVGQYRGEVLQQLPENLRDRYLRPPAKAGGERWRVADELRGMVHYASLDLLSTQWPVCETGFPFDAIFCRNVMIYLSDSARLHVFEKLSTLLQPDGLLILSRVEGGMNRAEPYFRPCGDSVYLLGPAARRAGNNRKQS